MSDNDKKLKGQITTNENTEVVRVTCREYSQYNKYIGGIKQVLFVNFVMVVFIVSKVYCDYLVGQWAYSANQQTWYWYFVWMITFTALLSSLGVFVRVYSLCYYCWYGNRQLHDDMLRRVFASPVNLYFDTTPIGRILNRFSKDLATAETLLPWGIGNMYGQFYPLMSVIAISIYVTPWICLVYPLIALSIVYFFKKSIAATKEVARVEAITKSPILNFLSESISGCSTLRAYDNKDVFIATCLQRLNDNIIVN